MIIAQVTDTHIKARGRLAYRTVDSAAALAACVDHLNGLDPKPDLVLMTGDLADMGRPGEYGLLRELLQPLTMPFFMIPGNHDDAAELRRAFPDHAYLCRDEAFIQYAIEDWPVRMIGLDTTIPGAKEGILCERRLRWLDSCLSRDRDRPTILFMHHPPFLTGISHMDVQNCGNAEGLAAVTVRHPQVSRLLCGHVHRAIQVGWHGIVASIGPSPSHAVALDVRPEGPPCFVVEPPACQLLIWRSDTGLVGHLSFIGAFDGPHPFFEPGGHLIE